MQNMVMFTCARMDATSFIIGNKIIDCKIFIVKIQFFIISSGNFIIWMRLEEIQQIFNWNFLYHWKDNFITKINIYTLLWFFKLIDPQIKIIWVYPWLISILLKFSVEMMQLIFLSAVETDYIISNSTVAKNTQL